MAQQENELRQRDLEESDDRSRMSVGMTQWARTLELSLLFASLHDAVMQLELKTFGQLVAASERVDHLVELLSHLDPRKVVHENEQLLRPYVVIQPSADAPATVETDLVVRAVQSLLIHCPIVLIEREGAAHFPDLAHRCRIAFDGLNAFVARHRHPDRAALMAAGRVYAEGRATVDEVGAMLGMDVPDVVAMLEENGFRRSVDGLRLTEEQRTARLQQIRDERLKRGGTPAPSESAVARDVIATQRIEGIDARSWLRR